MQYELFSNCPKCQKEHPYTEECLGRLPLEYNVCDVFTLVKNENPALNCPLSEFKRITEKRFKKGMTWGNFGVYWIFKNISLDKADVWFNLSKPNEIVGYELVKLPKFEKQ